MRLLVRQPYLLLLSGLAIAGLAWLLGNSDNVPVYGDTGEYLHLAQTLEIDQYRTILYPLYLHLSGAILTPNGATDFTWAYLGQILFSLAACAIFSSALALDLERYVLSRTKRRAIVAITTLVTATSPLVAHFSITLMSDSLASSFTVATVGALAHVLRRYAVDGKLSWPWATLAGLFLFLMALSRVDKLYVSGVLAAAAIFWLFLKRSRSPKSSSFRHSAVLLLMLSLSLAATVTVNKLTQRNNPERPPLDASSLIFNRVVWPRMTEMYPHLSVEAHALISAEQAKQFDATNNSVYPLLTRILTADPGNKRIINQITAETFRRFPAQVIGKTIFDITKYNLPIIAFPLELTSILPKSEWTDWTYTRMNMFHPRWTMRWLILSFACLLLIQLPLAIRSLRHASLRHLLGSPCFFLAIVTIGANSLLFGLEAGMDAHIRYALPTFTIEFAMITLIGLTGHISPSRRQT